MGVVVCVVVCVGVCVCMGLFACYDSVSIFCEGVSVSLDGC